MKIQVTQEDIDRGIAGSCGRCPITLAIRRATSKNYYTGVEDVFHMDYGPVIRLPFEAIKFIKNFDSGNEVKPFEFEVGI